MTKFIYEEVGVGTKLQMEEVEGEFEYESIDTPFKAKVVPEAPSAAPVVAEPEEPGFLQKVKDWFVPSADKPPTKAAQPLSMMNLRSPYEGARSEMDFFRGEKEVERYQGRDWLEYRDLVNASKRESTHVLGYLGTSMKMALGPALAGQPAELAKNPMVGGIHDPRGLGELITRWGPKFEQKAQEILDKLPEDVEFMQMFGPEGRGFVEVMKDPLAVPYFLAKSIPYMAALTGGAVVTAGNPMGAIFVGMNMYGGQAVQEYEQEMMVRGGEVDPRVASALYYSVGPINAALDFAGIGNLINRTPGARRLLSRLVIQGLREGTTEALQGAVEEYAAQIGYDNPAELWKIVEGGIIGTFAGTATGVFAKPPGQPGEARHKKVISTIADTITVVDEVHRTQTLPEYVQEVREQAALNFDTERIKAREVGGPLYAEREVQPGLEAAGPGKDVTGRKALRVERKVAQEAQSIDQIMELAGVVAAEEKFIAEEVDPTVEVEPRSIFRQPKNVTDFNAQRYEENPKLYQSSPETYYAYLMNGINQHLDGSIEQEGVGELYRDRLFELATNIDGPRVVAYFGDTAEGRQLHQSFKALVQDASTWAELATRENEPTILGDPLDVLSDAAEEMERGISYHLSKEVMTKLKANRRVIESAYEQRTGTTMDPVESNRKAVEQLAEEDPNFMLYSGLPMQKYYEGFQGMWKTFRDAKAESRKTSKKERYRTAKRMLWDHFGPIAEQLEQFGYAGQAVIEEFRRAAGMSAKADHEVRQAQKTLYKGLKRNDKELLEAIIFAKRLKAIWKSQNDPKQSKYHSRYGKLKGFYDKKTGLNIDGFAAEMFLNQVQKNIGAEKFAKLENRAKFYFDMHRRYVDRLEEEGAIPPATARRLRKHDYQRRQLIEVVDPDVVFRPGASLGARRTGVERLRVTGSETDILETDAMFLLQQFAVTVENAIAKNNAAKALTMLADKENLSNLIRKRTTTSTGKLATTPGWEAFPVIIDGRKQHYMMPKTIAPLWQRAPGALSYRVAEWLRISSGSAILKPMATGLNLKFAITQVPVDFMHMWWSSQIPVGEVTKPDGTKELKWKSTYNPLNPLAPLRFATDFGKLYGDAWYRRGKYEAAAKDGMLMHFLSQTDRASVDWTTGEKRNLVPIINFLSHLSTTNEIASRLALREQAGRKIAKREGIKLEDVWKNKEFSQQASFIARDYLDYSQGGDFTKTVDTFVPFLNASVQVTRGIFRAVPRNPGEQSLKAFMLAMPVGLSYAAFKAYAPEMMRAMSDRDKEDFFSFPIFGDNLYIVDPKTQEKRYLYLKIKLDKGQKLFTNMWRFAFMQAFGTEAEKAHVELNAADTLASIFDSLSPADVSSIPPSLDALIVASTNFDLWRKDKVWKKGEAEGRVKINPSTPQWAQDVGNMVNFSPAQLDVAFKKVFTDNESVAFVEHLYNTLRNVPPSQREDMAIELAYRFPFIGITNPREVGRDTKEQVAEEANTKKLVANRALEVAFERYKDPRDTKASINDVLDVVNKAPTTHERKRRMERYENLERMWGMDNYSFWQDVSFLSTPEERAEYFDRELKRFPQEKQDELVSQMLTSPKLEGIVTERFKDALLLK